jgi:hypothetical protein
MAAKEAVTVHFTVARRHSSGESQTLARTAGATADIRTAYFILKTQSPSQQI